MGVSVPFVSVIITLVPKNGHKYLQLHNISRKNIVDAEVNGAKYTENAVQRDTTSRVRTIIHNLFVGTTKAGTGKLQGRGSVS